MLEVIKVDDKISGNLKAGVILSDILNKSTFLFLSGGTSVDYNQMIVSREGLDVGAVGIVDERYGEPFHKDSNEFLIKKQGVFDWCNKKSAKVYKMLNGLSFEDTAEAYEKVLSENLNKFAKKVGVMGVGSNLHTAGIFPNSLAVKSSKLVVAQEVDDVFARRLTLTFETLKQFNIFIILMFGEKKKEAINIILEKKETELNKYPAIFYNNTSALCYLITDIKI